MQRLVTNHAKELEVGSDAGDPMASSFPGALGISVLLG